MFKNIKGIAHDKKYKVTLVIQKEKPANNQRADTHNLENEIYKYTVYDNGTKTEQGNIEHTVDNPVKELKNKLPDKYKYLADKLTKNTKFLEDAILSIPLKKIIEALNKNDGLEVALLILNSEQTKEV